MFVSKRMEGRINILSVLVSVQKFKEVVMQGDVGDL